ncbi:MAG: hypothetical protein ACI4I5_10845 [Acutalibacteraceae bacterium]
MTEKSIKQLTFSRWDGRCPVCGEMLSQKKHFNVELHDSNKQKYIVQSCELLYCDHCDLPLVDGKIISLIHGKTGMRPTTFTTKKRNLNGIKNQMYSKKKVAPPFSQKESNKEYREIGKVFSIWKPYKKLYSANGQTSCPKCHQQLIKGETIIPITESSSLIVEGAVCRECRSMFVKNANDIAKKLKDNPHSAGFYINDIAYWRYSEIEEKKRQEQKKQQRIEEMRARKEFQRQTKINILESIESSVVLISIMFQDKSKSEYVITANKNAVSSEKIIHYSSAIGRELLTAAYVQVRKKQGSLNGKKYRVCSVFSKHRIPETLIPSLITIKTDGGYSTSVKKGNCELIDLLLYSPYNDIYECVHATHDKKEDICFMDVSIYRRFVNNFGNPGLGLDFPMSASSGSGELNEESILKGYGYSVEKKENLSSVERQELLAELVDLEILSVAQIAHYLDFFIHTRTHPKYTEAVHKWDSDKRFIENYKVNPSRFMLSK